MSEGAVAVVIMVKYPKEKSFCKNLCYNQYLPVQSGLLLAHWRKADSSHPTEL
jgi:hypothetical protein